MADINEYFKKREERRRPYIIAEAGVNHEGSMELAKRLIDEAKEGGAQAIKFQTYKAETIASKYSPAYWDLTQEPTTSQYELFKKHDSFWKKEFVELFEYSKKVGIDFISTPFDVESADFLEEMCPVYKISSSDLTNLPFIEHMACKGKPILLSVGASTLDEIKRSVGWVEKNGNPLLLLHCILNYPTKRENAHLGVIKELYKEFPKYNIGYSDHTLPEKMDILLYAYLQGAEIMEKHFTFDKTLPGNDHYHAMDKEDLKLFWKKYNVMDEIISDRTIGYKENEIPARENARRSLVITKDIHKGTVLKKEHLTWKRPANGISPSEYYEILGRSVNKNLVEDHILTEDDLA